MYNKILYNTQNSEVKVCSQMEMWTHVIGGDPTAEGPSDTFIEEHQDSMGEAGTSASKKRGM